MMGSYPITLGGNPYMDANIETATKDNTHSIKAIILNMPKATHVT